MKLLFDQNLSHRLCRLLADLSPEASQVCSAGLDRASDQDIRMFAQREGFVIVTLDADFAEIATLRGAPPKVIWLRCGNQPTQKGSVCCAITAVMSPRALPRALLSVRGSLFTA
ncbi:MAG: DUF5615 family PIN-like protein [Hyphomonadaceae bacterium]|nr:DUF5615 family PIN-like protein [Hyphomonadaceae bacterium]